MLFIVAAGKCCFSRGKLGDFVVTVEVMIWMLQCFWECLLYGFSFWARFGLVRGCLCVGLGDIGCFENCRVSWLFGVEVIV